MNLFFLHSTRTEPKEQSDIHTLIHHEQQLYMDEGSEFLDDAIRMEDLPSVDTEEKAAAESSQNEL